MKKLGLIFVGIGIFIGIVIGLMYNSLVSQNTNVDAKWSQVENVMQRRYDLIPNLQNTVKGSMSHETKVFSQIADARKQYASANSNTEKLKANGQLTDASNMLISVINERYPELASNKNVENLMVQLEGTENRISTERREYILAVQTYNVTVKRFPTNLVARLFGYNEKPVYKADDKAQTVPSIDLDNE